MSEDFQDFQDITDSYRFSRSDSLSSLSDDSEQESNRKAATAGKTSAKSSGKAEKVGKAEKAPRRKSPPRANKQEDARVRKSPVGKDSANVWKSPVGKASSKVEKAEKKSPPRSKKPDAASTSTSSKQESSSRSPRRAASSSSASSSGEEYPFLDMKYVIAHTRGYEDLKVELRKTTKGVSMFARSAFKKGSTIAYYKLKIIKERSKKPRVKGGIYTFSIYDKEGEKIKTLTGDLCDESLEQPRRGVPFFAYFAKEPTGKQTCNAFMDDSLKDNYKDREEVQEGDFFTYRLVALRDVPEGEEICWYYGDHYQRDYKVSDCSR